MIPIDHVLRLTPVYAFLIGFTATVYVYLGDGPNWLPIEYISIQCRNGWWYNLLYINNFLPANPELLDHAVLVIFIQTVCSLFAELIKS